MKKIIAASALILILSGASAQFRERGFAFAPRATAVVTSPYWGYYPYMGLGGYPYLGYPYYYPYGTYAYRGYSKLDRQIADISQDYNERIANVRSDKTISRAERRSQIRELKKEKDNAIDAAKRNYFKSSHNQQSRQQQQTPPVQQQAPKETAPQTPATELQSTTTSSAM